LAVAVVQRRKIAEIIGAESETNLCNQAAAAPSDAELQAPTPNARYDHLHGRIRELEAALRNWHRYHAHLEFCNLARPCSCGFDRLAELIEKLITQSDGDCNARDV